MGLKITSLAIPEIKKIQLDVLQDRRGFFSERFNPKTFAQHGLPTEFAQDNHSHSLPGVLRGLHWQVDPPQGKLVGVLRGKIYDVCVDMREGSPTWGKWISSVLSEGRGELLWIPDGFAHGFCVLGSEPADVIYKTTSHYRPEGERGIRWNDPLFKIDWPIQNPILSERDAGFPNSS